MDRTAKASLLLPIEDSDRMIALRLANQAAEARNHRFFQYFNYGRAFADYRAGKHAAAAANLIRASGSNNEFISIPSSLILAMAQQQLGQPVEAKANLAHAENLIAEKMPSSDATDLGRNWNDVLFRILLREAREVIKGSSSRLEKRSTPGDKQLCPPHMDAAAVFSPCSDDYSVLG